MRCWRILTILSVLLCCQCWFPVGDDHLLLVFNILFSDWMSGVSNMFHFQTSCFLACLCFGCDLLVAWLKILLMVSVFRG